MAVTTAPQGYTYSGNNDFRGYLAANAPQYLAFTGNDGKTNSTDLANSLMSNGLTTGGDQFYDTANKYNQDVASLYSQYQGYQNQPLQTPVDQTAAQRAAYVGQLQGQLGQLDPQQDIGLQNIANSYNQGANRLDQQKAVAQRDYTTGVNQNAQTYSNNRNGIISNTRANANALQRLLGINGAGNSSAAYEQAPYAAALQGSTQLNQAQQTYGNNASALDTNWGDTQRGYSNAFDDLNQQRHGQENSLRSSIAQTRANILNNIANAGSNPGQYNDQINSLLSQITQLGKQYESPVLRVSDVAYQAPDMKNYFLNGGQQQAAQPQQAAGGAASDVNPTFLGLLQGQRDQYGNLIQG